MTDLTDRMRTCAAWIIEHDSRAGGPSKVLANVTLDAADLLIEASNALESYQPQTEPMEIIEPLSDELKRKIDTVVAETEEKLVGTWIAPAGTLPAAPRLRSLHACPKCDSRSSKRVRRDGNRLMLVCPVCAETWEFKR